MAIFSELVEGIEILNRYECGGDYIAAEHDQVWLGDYAKSERVMHESDVERLKDLGWFEDEGSWSFFA